MKKLTLTLLFVLLISSQAFAVAGPSQWSLAGVASWAQPLTASGTTLPATATYALGDLFALYGGAASTTFELYRLCASGTAGVWRNTGGTGGTGATTLLELTDLPDVTDNAHKLLALGTDTASFYWADAGSGGESASLTEHIENTDSPHGINMNIGVLEFNGMFGGIWGIMWTELDHDYEEYRVMRYNEASSPVSFNQVVVASFSADFDAVYPYIAVAPASATQIIGISQTPYTTDDGSFIQAKTSGVGGVRVGSDTAEISAGDWLITSDVNPGTVIRATPVGDVPLDAGELQRRVGISVTVPFWSVNATYTKVLLKGGAL